MRGRKVKIESALSKLWNCNIPYHLFLSTLQSSVPIFVMSTSTKKMWLPMWDVTHVVSLAELNHVTQADPIWFRSKFYWIQWDSLSSMHALRTELDISAEWPICPLLLPIFLYFWTFWLTWSTYVSLTAKRLLGHPLQVGFGFFLETPLFCAECGSRSVFCIQAATVFWWAIDLYLAH